MKTNCENEKTVRGSGIVNECCGDELQEDILSEDKLRILWEWVVRKRVLSAMSRMTC